LIRGSLGVSAHRHGARHLLIGRTQAPVVICSWASWTMQIRMLRQPSYPNLRLSDHLVDHDYFSGVEAGTLEVIRRPAAGGERTHRPGGH
jgi:hypothetical protein